MVVCSLLGAISVLSYGRRWNIDGDALDWATAAILWPLYSYMRWPWGYDVILTIMKHSFITSLGLGTGSLGHGQTNFVSAFFHSLKIACCWCYNAQILLDLKIILVLQTLIKYSLSSRGSSHSLLQSSHYQGESRVAKWFTWNQYCPKNDWIFCFWPFLAMLVALHFTPVSEWAIVSD